MATTTAAKVKPVGYTFNTIDAPGATEPVGTTITGISSQGEITGWFYQPNSTNTFVHDFIDNGIITSFDVGNSTAEFGSSPVPAGINNLGVVTGQVNDPDGTTDGFIYANGVATTFSSGRALTLPVAINDRNIVVGTTGDSGLNENVSGFVYQKGNLSLLNFPGAINTSLVTINSKGDIAGNYEDSQHHTHGFIDRGGHFTTINSPFGSTFDATIIAMNNNDDLLLRSDRAGSTSFVLEKANGKLLSLPIAPIAFNDSDVIVGNNSVYDSRTGSLTTIAVPGAFSTALVGIDNNGDIAGNYRTDTFGESHGFIAVPHATNSTAFTFADVSSPAAAGASGSAGSMTVLPDTSGSAMSSLILPTEQMIVPVV